MIKSGLQNVPPCALHRHSQCSGGITREHYISKAVLKLIALDGQVVIEGTPWAKNGPKSVSIESLTAKCLCSDHNSRLHKLDEAMKRFFQTIQMAQANLASASPKSKTNTFDGNAIERWFLKVAYMMWASGNFSQLGLSLRETPPDNWGKILIGDIEMPLHWGLYLPPPDKPFATVSHEFECTPLTGADEKVRAVMFKIARIPFTLVVGNPEVPSYWGFYRPSKLVLRKQTAIRTMTFRWTGDASGIPVVFDRIAD